MAKSHAKGFIQGVMKTKLSTAVLLAMGISIGVCSTSIQAKTLRSADVHPKDYPTVQAVEFMNERLKELTNGELDIKVYTSGQLGNEKATLEQTRFGVIDMNRLSLGEVNNLVEDTIVFSLPYVFRSEEHLHNVIDGPIGDEVLKSLESKDLVGLTFMEAGARNVYNRNHDVHTPEDLKGLKIRAQQSEIFMDTVNAMGANAVPMGFGEQYSALQTGVIDGAEQSWPTYQSTNHVEVAKHYSLTEHQMLPELLVMSKKTFDSLSDSQKAAVMQAADETKYEMRKLWKDYEGKAKQIVVDKGVIITEVDKDLFMKAVEPVQQKYLQKSDSLQKLFDRIQAVE